VAGGAGTRRQVCGVIEQVVEQLLVTRLRVRARAGARVEEPLTLGLTQA